MSTYSKLLLRPIEVQFAKNWDPTKSGSALYDMHEPDREKIKSELAEVFAEVFKKELEKGGYPLVTEPGADVVEMQAAIVNLYITAPDVSMDVAGRSKVYTSDAGHMTLIMQLHDSVTGQLLARAYDHSNAGPDMWTLDELRDEHGRGETDHRDLGNSAAQSMGCVARRRREPGEIRAPVAQVSGETVMRIRFLTALTLPLLLCSGSRARGAPTRLGLRR